MTAVVGTELACPPRYGTPRSPDRPTLGPAVADVASALGKPLLPHQRRIFDVAMEIDPSTGFLAYSEVVIVVPRQQGKTESLLPLMTHRCLGFGRELTDWIASEYGIRNPPPGAQRVLYTTQTASKAQEKWRDIHVDRLEKSPYAPLIQVRKRLNMEAIYWPETESSWSPGATTGKTGGTGDTLDLGVIDEAWSREDNRTELGMRPAMLTRPWRQLWVASMIPGLSRALPGKWPYLHQKRQTGRTRVEADMRSRVAYFEWSAPTDLDPADPETWWTCMPALGHTISEKNVREDFEAMDLTDFCAEYLGWEPESSAPKWYVIKELTWRALAIKMERGAYLDPVAFAIDGAPDQSVASIGMAALDVNGDTVVELIERLPGINWTVEAMVKLADHHGPCAIGIAAHGPCASLIEPLRRALLAANVDATVVTFQGPEVARACAQVYSETGQVDAGDNSAERTARRLRHFAQPELDAAVAGATKWTFGDQWRWQRQGEGGDVSPLYAVTLARAAGESVEWVGGSYDLADSLG